MGSGITAKDWLIYLGLPLVGAILGHLWSRYRRRLTTLRWTAHSQAVAFGTEDLGWGKVQILYEGQPAGNLHIVNVQIVNDSQRDLADVELNLQANEGTRVLRSAAQVAGTVNELPLAGGYAAMLAESGKRPLTDAELATWSRRSDFHVPVLNRGSVVDARLLAMRADYAAAAVSVHCNHVGVRVRHEPPAVQFWGVHQGWAALVGLIVGCVVVALTVRANGGTWLSVGGAWLVGSGAVVIGAGIIRAWRWLSRMAG